MQLSQWQAVAPAVATILAAVITATVSLTTSRSRLNRLDFAIRVRSEISRLQRDDWDMMIHNEVEEVLHWSTRAPGWVLPALLAGSGVSSVGILSSLDWLTYLGWAAVVAGWAGLIRWYLGRRRTEAAHVRRVGQLKDRERELLDRERDLDRNLGESRDWIWASLWALGMPLPTMRRELRNIEGDGQTVITAEPLPVWRSLHYRGRRVARWARRTAMPPRPRDADESSRARDA